MRAALLAPAALLVLLMPLSFAAYALYAISLDDEQEDAEEMAGLL